MQSTTPLSTPPLFTRPDHRHPQRHRPLTSLDLLSIRLVLVSDFPCASRSPQESFSSLVDQQRPALSSRMRSLTSIDDKTRSEAVLLVRRARLARTPSCFERNSRTPRSRFRKANVRAIITETHQSSLPQNEWTLVKVVAPPVDLTSPLRPRKRFFSSFVTSIVLYIDVVFRSGRFRRTIEISVLPVK